MTQFTSSDLKQKTGEVLNEVQRTGWVKIKSRSRPDMVLIAQESLDKSTKEKTDIINRMGMAMMCAAESISRGEIDNATDWLLNSLEGFDVEWPKEIEDLNEWFNRKVEF